jgi:hypothetical protein
VLLGSDVVSAMSTRFWSRRHYSTTAYRARHQVMGDIWTMTPECADTVSSAFDGRIRIERVRSLALNGRPYNGSESTRLTQMRLQRPRLPSYPRPLSGCFFHSRRLPPSRPTVRHGVCRHHRVVRCELATQMRSRAPSSVSWSTTIRCRLSSGRVRQAPRVPRPHHRPGSAQRVRVWM